MKKEKWLFVGRSRRQVRWAFRLFIISFIAFYVFSSFFAFTFMIHQSSPMGTIYSVVGQAPVTLVLYVFLVFFSLWLVGWALLWGEQRAARGRSFVIGSWTVPSSITYVWVSLATLAIAGVRGSLLTLLSLLPPLVAGIFVPQLFVLDFLKKSELKLLKFCVGVGLVAIVCWSLSLAVGESMLLVVEALLPLYFGLLAIEYLRVHLRLNGPGF